MNEKPPGKSKTKDSMLCRFCAYCTETSDQGGKGLNPASGRITRLVCLPKIIIHG
jgi:hypothetical protein